MHYMFAKGFLGTKAPFFIDAVLIITLLVPLLLWFGILLAKKRALKVHIVYQVVLFIVFLVVIGYFEYGIRSVGGFGNYLQNVSNRSAFYTLLVGHIVVAIFSTILWIKLLLSAAISYKKYQKILDSAKHQKEANILLISLIITVVSGAFVYIDLFT